MNESLSYIIDTIVLNLLGWRVSVGSFAVFNVVVMYVLFIQPTDARPIDYPRVIETADLYLDGVNPLFDAVSAGKVDLTAQL